MGDRFTEWEQKVTVSMPHWRTPELKRAVDAVLAQDHENLHLVIVNDGDAPIPANRFADPRVTILNMETNRGRYFCDAVVLSACDTPWFAIHDADDHAEPNWLSTMLELARRDALDAVFCPQWVHPLNGRPFVERTKPIRRNSIMRHLAHHAGLYRTNAYRRIGGPNPLFRVGYDSLVPNLLMLAGTIGVTDVPLYHRVQRMGSLTTRADTGFRSRQRRDVARDLERMYQEALIHGAAKAGAWYVGHTKLAGDVATQANKLRRMLYG